MNKQKTLSAEKKNRNQIRNKPNQKKQPLIDKPKVDLKKIDKETLKKYFNGII